MAVTRTVTAPDLFQENIEDELEQWDHEIEHYEARADIALAQIEERYYGLLRDLRYSERVVRENLLQFKNACDNCREERRRELERSANDLKLVLIKAANVLD